MVPGAFTADLFWEYGAVGHVQYHLRKVGLGLLPGELVVNRWGGGCWSPSTLRTRGDRKQATSLEWVLPRLCGRHTTGGKGGTDNGDGRCQTDKFQIASCTVSGASRQGLVCGVVVVEVMQRTDRNGEGGGALCGISVASYNSGWVGRCARLRCCVMCLDACLSTAKVVLEGR